MKEMYENEYSCPLVLKTRVYNGTGANKHHLIKLKKTVYSAPQGEP